MTEAYITDPKLNAVLYLIFHVHLPWLRYIGRTKQFLNTRLAQYIRDGGNLQHFSMHKLNRATGKPTSDILISYDISAHGVSNLLAVPILKFPRSYAQLHGTDFRTAVHDDEISAITQKNCWYPF